VPRDAAPLLQVVLIWRRRFPSLLAGLALSLAALAAGVALLGQSGAVLRDAILGLPLLVAGLWWLGPCRVVFRYAERLATHDATFKALADLRVWFFSKLAGGAAGGLGFAHAGDLLSRLVGDVDALDSVYLRIIVPLAGCLVLLPFLIGAAWPHGAGVTLGLLGAFVLCAMVAPLIAGRRAREGGSALAACRSALRTAALDAVRGLPEIRAFGAEGAVLARVQAREAGLLQAGRRLSRRIAWTQAAAVLCAQGAILIVLVCAPSHAPADIIPLAFIAVAVFEAAAALPRAGVLGGAAIAAARRVVETADLPAPVPEPSRPAAAPASYDLRLQGVGFAWPGRAPLFDGLSLDIPAGSRVAILGPSGSGKSTLTALLLKVAAPAAGRVTLGGVDMADLPAAVVRSRIAWLSQATHLFDDSVRANLLLARPDASDAELWAALEAARLHEVVAALPDRLDTWIGEAGARLSGGEGRRLALARTLLSTAPVLVLDEPCAGLDAQTEREFFNALGAAAEGRTVVLIVHRLTGAERLDRIWRLSGGRAAAAAA
jgi:ATP-binding cassette subfamily C protein CydC